MQCKYRDCNLIMQEKTGEKAKILFGAKGWLIKYIKYKGVKKSEFYRATALSNGFLDKNENIGSDKIEIIISRYQDLNVIWLITGTGEMLISDTTGEAKLVEYLQEKDKKIEALLVENTQLKMEIERLKQTSPTSPYQNVG